MTRLPGEPSERVSVMALAGHSDGVIAGVTGFSVERVRMLRKCAGIVGRTLDEMRFHASVKIMRSDTTRLGITEKIQGDQPNEEQPKEIANG